MLEEVWRRTFELDPGIKDIAKKAIVICFDSPRLEILAEESLRRWFSYFKAFRSGKKYDPPADNNVLQTLKKSIKADVERSRAAFDAAKEGILADMAAGQGFQTGVSDHKLNRLMSTTRDVQDGTTPQRKRTEDAETPEKTERQAGAGAKYGR
jgi:hypothetical protein